MTQPSQPGPVSKLPRSDQLRHQIVRAAAVILPVIPSDPAVPNQTGLNGIPDAVDRVASRATGAWWRRSSA